MAKFWVFKNIAEENGEEEIELRIEGEIIDDDYAWLYEWFNIPAASPNAFREELAQYKGKNITVWIDSYGGSVFAAAGMFNALMEHKRSGAKVSAKVTKAMSAATIPMMAADERLMTPGGIFMMHNPLTEVYGYASDLRKAADVLDVVKETIINAYQLGSGKSRAKISSMMDEETYMDARAAVKEGFATGMLYAEKTEPKVDENIVNLSFGRILAIQNSANANMRKFFELPDVKLHATQAKAPEPQPVANKTNKKDGDTPMFKDVNELRNACPDLVKQIEDAAREDGKKQERARIQDIEKISKNIAPDLVNKAKFEEPVDAKELAFQAMQKDNGLAQQHLDNLQTETKKSGAGNVAGDPLQQKSEAEKKEAENQAVDNIAAGGNKRRGK